MTLHATRDGQAITIHANTGTEVLIRASHIEHVRITEHAQHVRHFCEQLGKLLDAADDERKAAAEPASEHHGHALRPGRQPL